MVLRDPGVPFQSKYHVTSEKIKLLTSPENATDLISYSDV